MPMRTVFSLACVSMTISMLSISISITLLRRQWQRFFKHQELFFGNTHGRFLHIVLTLNDDDSDSKAVFLFMTNADFLALKGLAREVLAPIEAESTSCIPSPNSLYPDITHVYTSVTKFQTYVLSIQLCSVTNFFSDTSVSKPFLMFV